MIRTQTGLTPAWVLKIEGQLLDDLCDSAGFSEHLSQIKVELENEEYAGQTFEWVRRGQNAEEMDGFEITRVGDKPCLVKISLFLRARDDAKTFRPSETLREIIQKAPMPSASSDTHGSIMYDKQEHGHQRKALYEGTEKEILMAVWQYIKANRLQDPNNRKLLICDSSFQMLFEGKPTVNLAELHTLIEKHLLPVKPIILTYRVGSMPPSMGASFSAKSPRQRSLVDASESKNKTSLSVDISVPVLEERQSKVLSHLQRSIQLEKSQQKESEMLDQRIQLLGQRLHSHTQQHQLISRLTPYPRPPALCSGSGSGSSDGNVATAGPYFLQAMKTLLDEQAGLLHLWSGDDYYREDENNQTEVPEEGVFYQRRWVKKEADRIVAKQKQKHEERREQQRQSDLIRQAQDRHTQDLTRTVGR
jgi:hypothetical protein